jgi:hypothetical protein
VSRSTSLLSLATLRLLEPLELTLPASELPATELPVTELPVTKLPDIDLPDTELPDTDLPDTDLPDTELPDTEPFSPPRISWPLSGGESTELPRLSWPEDEVAVGLSAESVRRPAPEANDESLPSAPPASLATALAMLDGEVVAERVEGEDGVTNSADSPSDDEDLRSGLESTAATC